MISNMRLQNFKSWADTGPIRFAPITAFFGTNSSGKTSLLQALLLMKQSVESQDRGKALELDEKKASAYVNLGTFPNLLHQHDTNREFGFDIRWSVESEFAYNDLPEPLELRYNPIYSEISFNTQLVYQSKQVVVREFQYHFEDVRGEIRFGMQAIADNGNVGDKYDLTYENVDLISNTGNGKVLYSGPVKHYAFPDQVYRHFRNTDLLSQLVSAYEQLFYGLHYIGPLRSPVERNYAWSGGRPVDVGIRGENAIAILIADQILPTPDQGVVAKKTAESLVKLGLIHSFNLRRINDGRDLFEVVVQQDAASPEVPITDVGFGVSQILPVLVQCFAVQPGSTLLLEQPELHLHPSAQSSLADVLIDAAIDREIQIVVESHSEHFLHRLQRRIAEQKIPASDAALYFVSMQNGRSEIAELILDDYGNISNWPQNFFGDIMGDLVAMTVAAADRQIREA